MDARAIIIENLPVSGAAEELVADEIISALNAAGYCILHDSDNHGPTLEKCAEIADARYEGHSVAFGTMRARNYEHAGSTIATAIRAMGEKNDG